MDTASELVQPLSQVVARPVGWLWPGRLARGKLSIFDGDPDMGKSLAALDIAARITSARPFPDGSPALAPSNVVVINGEDSEEDTVSPRFRALGGDLNRAFILRKEFLDRDGPLRLPGHGTILERVLTETRAVLVVLDPITAFLDAAVNLASDVGVRWALKPLADAAARSAAHIIMIRHLNKSGNFRAQYRGGGSIALLAACRSAYLFARHPFQPVRVMAQVKNNLGPRQPALFYRVHGRAGAVPQLDWLGECPLTADQLLVAAGKKPALPGPRERARDFLTAFLEDGPRTTVDIMAAAQEQGLSGRTLRRACKEMKIESRQALVENRYLNFWLLPGQHLPTDPHAAAEQSPLDAWLAQVTAQYPTDPLEDPDA